MADESSWDATGKNDEIDRLFGFNLSPKCVKRPTLDETSYSKPDHTEQNDPFAKDSTRLRSLIQSARKIEPYVSKPVPKGQSKCRRYQPQISKIQLERLNEIQQRLNVVQQELINTAFLERFQVLDQLRACFAKRFSVILGEFLPQLSSRKESKGEDAELREVVKEKMDTVTLLRDPSFSKPWKGFWLGAMDRCLPLTLMIYPWDREILAYLIDIRCTNFSDPPAFSLDFLFANNPYFSDGTLSRHFEYRKNAGNDFANIAENYSSNTCTGWPIHWYVNKDPTIRLKSHKISQSETAPEQPAKVTCPKRSFFHFFSPLITVNPDQIEAVNWRGTEEQKKVLQMTFDLDFYTAEIIRSKLIPHAVMFYLGTSKDPLCVPAMAKLRHPARKAASADVNRLWTTEELELMEQLWLKKDGEFKPHDCEAELSQHIQRGLERIGYRVRQGRAYRQGVATTSGDSSSDSSCPGDTADGAGKEETRKKSFRGLLETNTGRQKRRHGGIKFAELCQIADQPASEDDTASHFEWQSDSGESCNSDIGLLSGVPLNRRKNGKSFDERKVKRK